jgi:hypothetical protein
MGSVFIAALILYALLCACTAEGRYVFSGGKGTAEAPYLIATPDDLRALVCAVNETRNDSRYHTAHYLQTADIDLAGEDWTPIGVYWGTDEGARSFRGYYDGAGHAIRNMAIRYDFGKYLDAGTFDLLGGAAFDQTADIPVPSFAQGLFGYVQGDRGGRAVIEDVTLEGCDIKVKSVAGIGSVVGTLIGICGNTVHPWQGNVTVRGCTISGASIASNAASIGGFAGVWLGRVSDSSTGVRITVMAEDPDTTSHVGGFMVTNGGTVKGCRASVRIEGVRSAADDNLGFVAGFCVWNGYERPDEESLTFHPGTTIVDSSVKGEFLIAPDGFGEPSLFCSENTGTIRRCGATVLDREGRDYSAFSKFVDMDYGVVE